MMTDKRGLVLHGNKDDAFPKSGYSQKRYWRDLLVKIPSSTSDVGECSVPLMQKRKLRTEKCYQL